MTLARAERHARTPPRRQDVDDEPDWVDLDTMSVDLRSLRVRTIRPAPASALVDGRLAVSVDTSGMTVSDVLVPGSSQRFHERVRWVGGFVWSSGDLLLASDRRIARVEFTSTAPRSVGATVWELPPVEGSCVAAVLTGPLDASPNEAPKYVVFAGYEPRGSAPVAIAATEALGKRAWRETLVQPSRPCARREVRLVEREPRQVVVVVACPEGATVTRRQLW